MRDLLCHLIIDAQDVLITLVTPTDAEPTRNEVTYWDVAQTPPKGDEPLGALTRRPRLRSCPSQEAERRLGTQRRAVRI